MDTVFLITTYNRQESCQRLVNALQGQGDIVVINDGCDYDIIGCEQHKQGRHYGKILYWQTVNNLFQFRGNHKYYIMLPDDFMPIDNIAEKAVELWRGIDDPKKICLNLLADRIGTTCWTGFNAIDAGNVWRTGWVDMCFLCEESFFNQLGTLALPNMGYRRNHSSGVGMYISRRLHKKEFHFYQVKESLVIMQEEHTKSQMQDVNNNWDRQPFGKRVLFITDTRQHRGSGR
jgi:hypothetical protein